LLRIDRVSPRSGSNRRVSWTTRPPSSISSICRRTSNSIAVAYADPADEPVQCLRVRDRFFGAAQLGLGHDLEQRRAGAVEIDTGHPMEVFVQRLAGILFEMRPS